MIQTAWMLQRHLPNVLTWFKHRITNAVSEGLSSKIQTIKKRAYGFCLGLAVMDRLRRAATRVVDSVGRSTGKTR